MFRYKLRTLLVVLALAPLLLAVGYLQIASHWAWRHRAEGPLIYRASFLGNRAHSDKKLSNVIAVNSGLRLNAYTAGDSLRRVKAFYVEQGYPQVAVTLLEGGRPGDTTLAFQIVEGERRLP